MENGNISPLRKLRRKFKIKQKDVSDLIGCSEKTYRGYEIGSELLRADSLITLARFFKVSADYILGLSVYERVEYEDISAITGLSEAAISTITDDHCADIVSLLVTQPEFLELVDILQKLTDKEAIERTNMKNHVAGIWERGLEGNKYYSVDADTAFKYKAHVVFQHILDRLTEGSENNG